MDGVPPVLAESNVAFHVGWFEDTLPLFLEAQGASTPCALIHIDCDVYVVKTQETPSYRESARGH